MLIRESRLRELVRQVLQEGGGGDDLELSDADVVQAMNSEKSSGGKEDMELSVEEIKDALSNVEEDLYFDEEEVRAAYQASRRDENVRQHNLELTSQYLLKMKSQSPGQFKKVAAVWAPYVRNQKAGMVQWMKALESDDVQTQLGYSNIDKYQDLSRQFLKNSNWKEFVKWYFKLATRREIKTGVYKIANPGNRTVTADTIKVKSPRTVTADPIKLKQKGSGSGRMMAY